MSTHLAPLRRSLAPESWRGGLATILALFTLVLFGATATIVTMKSNDQQASSDQRNLSLSVGNSLSDRLSAYDEVLYGVRGAFGIDPQLTRRAFHELLLELDVDQRQPGVHVVGAAHLVEAGGRTDAERSIGELATASALGYPIFEIYPESTGDDMLPIDYVDPLEGNERAFGLDLFSEPNRRAAAVRARDTGLPSATGPITLVQETGSQRAFLVMLPLYREGSTVSTTAQRRTAFEGVTYAAFRMGDLMDGVLGPDGPDTVAVFDVESGEILYDRAGDFTDGDTIWSGAFRDDPSDTCPPFCGLPDTTDDRVVEIETAGRTWRLFVADNDTALSPIERAVPIVTMLGGLLVAGLIVAIVLSMRSARRRALELAAEMTSELEALTDSADEAILSVDESGIIVAWNRGAARIFGADADTMIGRAAETLTPPSEPDAGCVFLDHGPDGAQTLVAVGCRSDGSEFPLELSRSIWWAGQQRFVTFFVRDVTARVDAERALTATGNLLRGVLDAATGMAIIGTDAVGTVNVFNSGAERMLGYEADEVVGRHSLVIFHDPSEIEERARELNIEAGVDVFITVARREGIEMRQWTYLRSNGRHIPVELTVTPRYDGDGVLCGYIVVGVDITERLDAIAQQQDLLDQEREMVAKLTELDEVKNDFVSTISHELRTPLTSIIGYTELLADDAADDMSPRHLDMVGVVTRNAQRLLLLVEDLLALSRIESGELSANRAPCDIGEIFRPVEVAIAPLASERGISVTYEIRDAPYVLGDTARLERVFLNLLSNAIKFSHESGHVDVVVSGADGHVVVRVTDHGIGIPADEVKHLFTRFFRSRTAEKHAIQGTGLGLTIVADIVGRHNGTIEVESVEGEGTTMTVRLPTVDASQSSDDPPALSVGLTRP